MYHKEYNLGFLKTSDVELRQLFKAWVAISIAFGILLSGGRLFSSVFLSNFILAGLSVGIGFIFHELGHKVVAQHFGCFAEFRSFDFWLVMAIIMSFFGFLFAAPGAVMIHGPVGIRRNGKISAAGPGMSLFLAVFFLGNLLLFPFTGFLLDLFVFGFAINTFLAIFNLIPILNFDGRKIWTWNKAVYVSMMGSAVILLVVQGLFFPVF